MNKELFSKICNEYKLQPKNLQLYEEAFTHVSYSFENKLNYNYEKLEFLGDAVIGKNIALYLFKKYNDMSVGDMSKTKIIMVQSRTLAKASEVMGLRDLINVGKSVGDKKNITENIMEDVFESFIGALFLDLGEKKCFYVLKRTIIHFYEIN
jgi:ribonuclease-3